VSDAAHDAAGAVAGGGGRPDRDASVTAPNDRIRVAAYAVIRDADGRFLLCHIAPSVGVGDVWTLPGGGVDFGESPAHAVLRELTEETGLTGELEGLVDVSDRLFGGTGDRLHAIRILYAVRITGGELRDERDGSTDTCRWVTAAEARGMRLGELARAAINRLDASHPETA
jgi:ADP-ribose pyrophosphatase YjhB (NUDIX family)